MRVRKIMKKKTVVTIVSLCTSLLVFVGLVFCGIKTFPELLLTDEQKAELREQRLLEEEAAYFETPVFEEAIEDTFIDTEESQEVSFFSLEESSFDVAPASFIDETSFVEEATTEYTVFESEEIITEDIVEEIVVEETVIEEVVSESYPHETHGLFIKEEVTEEVPQTEPMLIKETTSQRNTSPSNIEINSSLLVISACEILSFLLIRRKKHLFR